MSKLFKIGLISSTAIECGKIITDLKLKKKKDFFAGSVGNKRIMHVISGIGKTNAAHAATVLIREFSPNVIINFGIGGAYPSSGLGLGDIAIAEKEVYGDEGILQGDGFHTADAIGIPFLKKGRKKYFNEFPLDKKFVKKAICVFKHELHPPIPPLLRRDDRGVNIKSGVFVTVSAVTGTDSRAGELEKRFNAICENMEGGAIAHVCAMYGVPMLEIRGISNIVEKRDKSKWEIKMAAENCQRALLHLLKASVI